MSEKPQKSLTLLDSVMLIMGSMIGSGIFIVAADMTRDLQSPGLLILAWIVTGFMTFAGALSYGELAGMMPQAGGQYVYLKEAFNPLVAFMYGWTFFAVIQTGTIAAVAVAFAKFTGVFLPVISAENYIVDSAFLKISTQQVLAIFCIVLLTFSNFRSIKTGALIQNLFTFAKIGSLVAIILLGIYIAFTKSEVTQSIWDFNRADGQSLPMLALVGIFFSAMVGSLFSSDAWNNITFTAGEVKNPQRNVPLALAIGTASVSLIYIFINITYVSSLSLTEIQNAPADRVATVLMEKIVGEKGVFFIAAMVMVSTFGCINGLILAGGRVYYAMAIDKLFFKQAARLNRNGVPANALVFQGIWACALTLSGSYNSLLDYVMFATVLFYILTILGVFILRSKQPNALRPYKAWGYPVLPALYILLAGGFCISALYYNYQYTLIGLGIVLVGIPIYYLIKTGFNQKQAEKIA
ncbi:amino acid permease [Cytophagaceae bacterium DM2B3-1]|uniref:Amino acid permease n=1 Tax=Xanthocytophaga flava TaxID=3048013 RepID=A0ABT7CVT9_9BACT|nr:amino acid permease [Xanthocytophaga flavus]MDJ1497898.1 amino acid permease [Xanthocytophaga flavus]